MNSSRVSGVRGGFISLVLTLLWLAAPADVTAQTTQFDITSQPLAAALNNFARQAGLQLVFSPDLVKGKTSTAVSGKLEVRQALAELLRGTGLQGDISGSTLTVERLPDASKGNDEARLPVVQVEGEATGQESSAWSPLEGYVAKRSATGTRSDTPLIETPRSISVIGAQEIDDRKSTKVPEALRYTPGVVAESRGIDFSQGFAFVRGFAAPIYQDGAGQEIAIYSTTGQEPYGMERIEVLRGPASVLYGQGQPGGVINTITKRPTDEFFAEVEGNAGSYNQFAGKFDVGGAMDKDKKLLFRLTGLSRDGDTQVDTLKEQRTFIAPAFTWRPGVDTSLTILSHFQRDETVGGQFVPYTALTNPLGSISTSTLLSEPGFEKWNRDETSIGYLFEHQFSDTIAFRQKLRYDKYDLDYDNIGTMGFEADNRTLNRYVFTALEDGDNLTSDTNFEVKAGFGATSHTILGGIDTKSTSLSHTFTDGPAPSIDAFNPVYGQAITIAPAYLDESKDLDQVGIYLHDQIKIADRWVMSLGARHDTTRLKIHDRLTDTDAMQKDRAFTGQAGLVYLFDNGLAPYVSYATSFEPQLGTDAQGNAFVPTTGKQIEAGVKFQPKGSNAMVTASVFEITRRNALTTDPVDPLFSTQTGEVRATGVELEAKFSVLYGLDLTAAYTYIDTEITKSNDGEAGFRFGSVPRHAASLWGNYSFARGDLGGLGAGAGVRYVGSTLDFSNTVKTRAFTLVDAALHYDFQERSLRGMRVAVNASNLFDKVYLSSCDGPEFCFFGQRRTITGSVRYRW